MSVLWREIFLLLSFLFRQTRKVFEVFRTKVHRQINFLLNRSSATATTTTTRTRATTKKRQHGKRKMIIRQITKKIKTIDNNMVNYFVFFFN